MKKRFIVMLVFLLGLMLVGCQDNSHEHDYHLEVVKPTCTTEGYTINKCACGDEFISDYVSKLEHDYSEWKVVKEATLEEEGSKERTCSVCGEKEVEKIEKLAHQHSYTEEIIEPTCVEGGYTIYTCKCGDTYKANEIAPLGHIGEEGASQDTKYEYVFYKNVQGSKEKTGYRIYRCKECKGEKYEYTNPLKLNDEELKDINILFIGNSYTNYNTLIECFKKIANGEGHNIKVTKVAYGSQYLHDYVEGEKGDYFYKVKEAVTYQKFDLAVIQGQSKEPLKNPGDFYSSARKLVKYLEDKGITCLFYQTWGYPTGYSSSMAELGCSDTADMAKKLAACYEAIGEELNVEVSPAGTAMLKIFEKYYDENKDLVYASNGNNHPSSIGTYLVALCHYAKIFGKNPRGINYKYNDYANDPSITWHSTKVESISTQLQMDLEVAALGAVYGASIVTAEYKTSSVGIE